MSNAQKTTPPEGFVKDDTLYSLEIRPTVRLDWIGNSLTEGEFIETVVSEGAPPPEPELLTGPYSVVSKRADELNASWGWPMNVTQEIAFPYPTPAYLASPAPIEKLAA